MVLLRKLSLKIIRWKSNFIFLHIKLCSRKFRLTDKILLKYYSGMCLSDETSHNYKGILDSTAMQRELSIWWYGDDDVVEDSGLGKYLVLRFRQIPSL